MNMRFYTNEQVHQIVDELLIKLVEAAVHDPELSTLTTKYRQQSSPENKVTLTVTEASQLIGICKPKMYEIVRAGKVRFRQSGKEDSDLAAVSAGLVEERRNLWR